MKCEYHLHYKTMRERKRRQKKKTYQIADASILGDPIPPRRILPANIWIWNCEKYHKRTYHHHRHHHGRQKKYYANAECAHYIIAFGNESANESTHSPKIWTFSSRLCHFLRPFGIEMVQSKPSYVTRDLIVCFIRYILVSLLRIFTNFRLTPVATHMSTTTAFDFDFMLATNTFYAFPMQSP